MISHRVTLIVDTVVIAGLLGFLVFVAGAYVGQSLPNSVAVEQADCILVSPYEGPPIMHPHPEDEGHVYCPTGEYAGDICKVNPHHKEC